jgi:hypothetical protein
MLPGIKKIRHIKKNTGMKKLGIWLTIIAGLTVGFLLLPSNGYLRNLLVHLYPKIDQHTIFENRVVKAGDPRAWEKAAAYNTLSVSPEYQAFFDTYETVAFVVIKDNRLLYEAYWDGYSPQSHSNSFSMAKSIVSLGIGCAIDDGFVHNVDQPVSDFFPEFAGYNGRTLTLRHLLTMSAGVDFEEA